MELTQKEILKLLENESERSFGCSLKESSRLQVYKALCAVIRDLLSKKRKTFRDDFIANERKQVYYMSMEFLVGTSLRNNLFNLGLEGTVSSLLKSLGISLSELYEIEPDAGLGNGGLGRLASCYMDSATTLGIPATGFPFAMSSAFSVKRSWMGGRWNFPTIGSRWATFGYVQERTKR